MASESGRRAGGRSGLWLPGRAYARVSARGPMAARLGAEPRADNAAAARCGVVSGSGRLGAVASATALAARCTAVRIMKEGWMDGWKDRGGVFARWGKICATCRCPRGGGRCPDRQSSSSPAALRPRGARSQERSAGVVGGCPAAKRTPRRGAGAGAGAGGGGGCQGAAGSSEAGRARRVCRRVQQLFHTGATRPRPRGCGPSTRRPRRHVWPGACAGGGMFQRFPGRTCGAGVVSRGPPSRDVSRASATQLLSGRTLFALILRICASTASLPHTKAAGTQPIVVWPCHAS